MILTGEQRKAVECDQSVYLTACPGSGKTRVITSKLARCLEEVGQSPRAVACITYTNAAVHEIEARVRSNCSIRDGSALDICTIHAFCLNNIFRPHCHRLPDYVDGFTVIAQDSDEYAELVEVVRAEFGKRATGKDAEAFAQLQIDSNGVIGGAPITDGSISVQEATLFWSLMRQRSQVDFVSILYLSLVLVRNHGEIADHLASRFAWVLVDEFQDTTDLQIEIFLVIHLRRRTKFFLVGDPSQSIYGFAGASPQLAEGFATEINARRDFQLTGNFRSSPAIVGDAECLLPRLPAMSAVGKNRECNIPTECVIATSPLDAVLNHFLPSLEQRGIPIGEAAVLASSWFKLIPIGKGLRKHDIPILGPGARPYRRQRLFASLAERVCGYLCEPDFEALIGVERALYDMLLEGTGRPPYDLFTYGGRVLIYKLLGAASDARDQAGNGMELLHSMAMKFTEQLVASGHLAKTEQSLLSSSVIEMEHDMRGNKVEPASLSVDDLGLLARPKRSLKLLTFHASKGREFSAVAMVDLNEGSIPFYRATSADELAEARRLFYVGATRAQRFLMYATDTADWRNRPSRYLGAPFLGKL